MLSISKAIKAGGGEYYLSLAGSDDYYLKGTEPPGFWLGTGAAALGLSGEVQPDSFRNLLKGFSPDGERKLVKNADSERRAGFDLTWSVPKSVSVAWSQADPEVRSRIEGCVRQAVATGLNYLEEVAGVSRRGADGHRHEHAKLVFACFEHSTSRAQDPQLHVHSILNNVGVRFDGTTGTVEPREIFRHKMAAGTLFRAELAALLERELGLRAMREGRAFELIGVDRELMATFSQRRREVLEALDALGLSGAKAAAVATLDTRTKKETATREDLFARWQETGREHGWTAKELSFLINAPFPARDMERERVATATAAVQKLTEAEAHFTIRRLTQAIAEEAQGRNLGAKEVLEIQATLLRSPEFVSLGNNHGEEHFTTKQVLALEAQLLRECETLNSFPTARIEVVAAKYTDLSPEQRVALESVCAGGPSLRVVTGLAGTGKSTLFRVAREEWERGGFTVLGSALAGKAARGLEESTGIKSQTLHRTLLDVEQGTLVLNAKTVWVIDEAAMVGTRQLASVASNCVKAGAILVLTGDEKQLQPIEFGGGFAEIARRYGAAELTEIRRQREEWAKTAVKDLSAGEVDKGLGAFLERGLVVEAQDGHWGAMERLVGDWSHEPPNRDRDTILIAGTNAEVSALNRLAQEARRASGALGERRGAVGKEEFFDGDRVLFRRNSMALSVMNGDRGTVRQVSGQGMTVELDSGALVRVDLESYPHLRLGYASTTHASQGLTCEKAFILVSDRMVDREMTYVQASRARGETRWYVSRDLDEVARSMEKSNQKQMASTFNLWAQAGPELELNLAR